MIVTRASIYSHPTSSKMPDHVNFITGNANKLREVKLILEPAIEVRSQAIDVEEVQGTIEEVTKSKCRKAAELVSTKKVLGKPSSLTTPPRRPTDRFLLKTRHSATMPLVASLDLTCEPRAVPYLT